MAEELKSLADLPQLIREQSQEQNNSEQEQQQPAQEQRPVSKYAAKQQRRRSLAEGPRDQNQRQPHEIRRGAQLQDTEKWMAVVRLATSLDQISAKVENIETRLNALVLPEAQPPVDMEVLRKDLWEDSTKQGSSIVNLMTVKLEEQCQDLRERQKALQTQITNEVTTARERIQARLSEVWDEVIDTRDLLRELMRRVGDPADTPISSRLREVQYIVKRLENPPDDPKEDPQDRTHWLPRWACQLLFGSDEVHVTGHGVWAEVHIGDKTDYGADTLFDLWKRIRSARRAYKVQQKIQKLQEQLNQSNTAAK